MICMLQLPWAYVIPYGWFGANNPKWKIGTSATRSTCGVAGYIHTTFGERMRSLCSLHGLRIQNIFIYILVIVEIVDFMLF